MRIGSPLRPPSRSTGFPFSVRRSRSHRRRRTATTALVLAVPFACLVPATSVAARDQGDVFTPLHVARTRSVGRAEISPDGSTVAYLLTVPRVPFEDDNGTAWTELHVLRPDGTSRPYVTDREGTADLAWTPDGTALSFVAKRGDDSHASLYVLPIDGGEARRVLSHETGIRGYEWSPDGTRVAFTATDELDQDRKELKDKGFDAEIYEEDWLPIRLWVGTPDDATAKSRVIPIEGTPSFATWSPDGRSLAVVVTPTPLVDDGYVRKTIRLVDVETGGTRATIRNPGKLGPIAWSPDGSRLAFVSAADPNDHQAGRLMIARTDDGAFHDVLPGYEGHVSDVAWTGPDTLLFLGNEGVWTTVSRISTGGGERQILIPADGPVFLSMRASKDGSRLALLGQTPHHPTELYTFAVGEDAPRRATNSNPWLDDLRFAPQEVVTYEARDGLRLEGILIRPLEEVEGQRYPLILTVHGGPESHYRNGWLTDYSLAGQVGAAEGFAVFYPNYRGSTGRGVSFAALAKDDPAGKEFDDLVDGVDHLIESGLVDRDRVGITGGSYGGYATAWGATYYTDRFAAGVMFVGISDRISKAGTTDIPHEMHQVHDSHWPWDDWQFSLERSPIFHVEKAHTPLLILHGKEDPRVHPGQSMELYRHLKVLGKTPVRLVFYPGEGHGNRKAAGRFDYNLRLLRWMKHYLAGPGGDPPPYAVDYPEPGTEEDAEAQPPPTQ